MKNTTTGDDILEAVFKISKGWYQKISFCFNWWCTWVTGKVKGIKNLLKNHVTFGHSSNFVKFHCVIQSKIKIIVLKEQQIYKYHHLSGKYNSVQQAVSPAVSTNTGRSRKPIWWFVLLLFPCYPEYMNLGMKLHHF